MISAIGEVASYYRAILQSLQKAAIGFIDQSFQISVREQLNDYYQLIVTLETLNNIHYNIHNNITATEEGNSPFTLKGVYQLIYKPMHKLKWLAVICEGCQHFSGSQAISVIRQYC